MIQKTINMSQKNKKRNMTILRTFKSRDEKSKKWHRSRLGYVNKTNFLVPRENKLEKYGIRFCTQTKKEKCTKMK